MFSREQIAASKVGSHWIRFSYGVPGVDRECVVEKVRDQFVWVLLADCPGAKSIRLNRTASAKLIAGSYRRAG